MTNCETMIADRATLEALRERVQKAEGPEPDLDNAIWLALCWKNYWPLTSLGY